MSKITVYTCITSGKDKLIDKQVKGDAKFVAYVENMTVSDTWEQLKAYDKFVDPRRNSRIQKVLAHQYVDSEYSIYIDGNIRLLVTPEQLIEKYLKDYDMAVFKHPNRDCIYDEAMVCAKKGLDDVETIITQAKMYEDSGYAKHKGLFECGILIRRHSAKVEELNNTWWSELCRHSRRDQISFAYAVDKVGISINPIQDYFILKNHDEFIKQGGEFQIVPHNHFI